MFSESAESLPKKLSSQASVAGLYKTLFHGLDSNEAYNEFWTQLFSSCVDDKLFMKYSQSLSTLQFLSLQPTWKMLVLNALDCASQTDHDMTANSLDILIVYFKALFKLHSSDANFVLFFSDWDSIESFLERITRMMVEKLTLRNDIQIRKKAFYLISVLIVDSPLDNILNDYFIARSELLGALLIFGTDPANSIIGPKCLICLSLLLNYKRYETRNFIYFSLARLNDVKLCNHLASVFMESFWKTRMAYEIGLKKLKESQKLKMSSFGISKERKYLMVLFYDCVYTNDYFTKILAFKHLENNPIFSVKAKGSGIKIGTAVSEFTGMCNQIFMNSADQLYSKLGVQTLLVLLQNDYMCNYLITEEYHVNKSLIDLVYQLFNH